MLKLVLLSEGLEVEVEADNDLSLPVFEVFIMRLTSDLCDLR